MTGIGALRRVLFAGIVALPGLAGSQVTPPGPPAVPAPAPAPAPLPGGPAIGSLAPDFSLPGATRYGLLGAPVRLSDYRGQTVVLAFFVQARTKG